MDNPSDDDVWHVQLPSGDVCMMTLDLLDDAFQDGLIHERSLVWKEGSPGWTTLAEVAGLDSEPEPATSFPQSSPSYAPAPYSMGPLSTAPVATDLGDMDFDLEAVSFRPRRRSRLGWLATAAVIGVAVFGFTKRAAMLNAVHLPTSNARAFSPVWDGPSSPAAGALMATPAVPVTPPPVAAPVAAPPPDSRLSDETKRALEEADKKLAAKQQQKQQQLQSRSVDRPKAKLKSDNPFHKGGNKFDPLNASL